jgi:hypothetical protein
MTSQPMIIKWGEADEEPLDPLDGVEFDLEHESLSCLKIDNIFDKVVELLQIEKAIKYRLEREKKKEEDRLLTSPFKITGPSQFEKNIDTCTKELDSINTNLDILRQKLEDIPLYREILKFGIQHNIHIRKALHIRMEKLDKITREEILKTQKQDEEIQLITNFTGIISSIQNLNLGNIYRRSTDDDKKIEIIKFINIVKKLYNIFIDDVDDTNLKTFHLHYIEYLKNIVITHTEYKDTEIELCDIITDTLEEVFDSHTLYLNSLDLEESAYSLFCSYNNSGNFTRDQLSQMWHDLSLEEKIEWISNARE